MDGNVAGTNQCPIHSSPPYHQLTSLSPPSNVIAVAVGAIPLLGFIHGSVVNSKRSAAKIPYPHTYATIEQCKASVRTPEPPP